MGSHPLHGVNLTGWLTLESWVTPELFAEAGALDEQSLANALGPRRYADLVRSHRAEFVTREDFARIAARGFNAVRLPVPWYVYGEQGPEPGPYVGCIELVDQALEWAEEIDLKVIFALAINPGAPCPDEGVAPDNADCHVPRERILDVVYALAKRYALRAGFFGIELADDAVPQVRRGLALTDGVPIHRLRNYYREAYELVRSAAGEDPVVIIPDGGIPGGWGRFMAQRHYVNVWLDSHLDRPATRVDVSGPSGVRRLVAAHDRHLREARRCGMPVMVGKWSSSLPVADAQMTPEGRIALERVYTSEQLGTYEKCPAWFFNTWKTSGLLAGWDARVALATFERGMIV
ncbi:MULTISPECIES: cellulase family glycosylhydrolase [Atopobiaceae]|uniref:glycoside hydrolase family 5 protein n=1 Tax=Atopobiaceae TaxID=1643824 RepID=UPI000B39D8AD|nr:MULTISPECIES: cellulase family glycosylhydrolase [Atopobiaceae]MCR8907118.1 cellulase family glycosylhydrolase [Thermophilibacter sp. ET337]OUO32499.1 glucan 1,3-beta-glucosidase [Olsenella sp. An293]